MVPKIAAMTYLRYFIGLCLKIKEDFEIYVTIVGNPSEIRTQHFQNINIKRYL
jgi:hypothetical protein